MTNETGVPQGNPGDIINWPMLKLVYRTDPDKIAALLPPGIEPGADPYVRLTIYNFPVPDEPEYEYFDERAKPTGVEVPWDRLAPETLRQVIESFVHREGTDYGEQEASLERKVDGALQ